MADALAPASAPSAGWSPTCRVGGEATAGSPPPVDPAVRLVPTPFGLEAHRGAVALTPLIQDGVRMLRVELYGAAVEVALDDDARDHLAWLCTHPLVGDAR